LSFPRCVRAQRAAFTLVECLVALAITATCLTALLLSRTDAVAQASRAALVAAATDCARQLATQVRLAGVTQSGTITGTFEEAKQLHFRQTSGRLRSSNDVELWQVRIEIFASDFSGDPLCDVVVWTPSRTPARGGPGA